MRGGKREGAGRKPGTPNKRTLARLEVARLASESGVSSLHVMLRRMHHHYALAEAQLALGAKADMAKVSAEFAAAHDAAKDAAPYQHPRLASVEHTGRGGGAIEITDARERFAHLVLSHAAAGLAGDGADKPH